MSTELCGALCTKTQHIPYSGKLSREKTFANFTVLWLIAKVFSAKFGSVASFGTAKANNQRKFSPQKSYFSPVHESFLPQKFPAVQYATLNLGNSYK